MEYEEEDLKVEPVLDEMELDDMKDNPLIKTVSDYNFITMNE